MRGEEDRAPMPQPQQDPTQEPSALTHIVARNIQALLERRKEEDRQKRPEDRVADAVTRFTGSMRFVYLHLLIYGLWIVINLGWLPLPRFDPTFVALAMVASVESIFLSTFILISQNRMQVSADKRADLDLHVSLLAEHEITRILTMVQAIAQTLNLEEAHDPELVELGRDVAPEKVLDELEIGATENADDEAQG